MGENLIGVTPTYWRRKQPLLDSNQCIRGSKPRALPLGEGASIVYPFQLSINILMRCLPIDIMTNLLRRFWVSRQTTHPALWPDFSQHIFLTPCASASYSICYSATSSLGKRIICSRPCKSHQESNLNLQINLYPEIDFWFGHSHSWVEQRYLGYESG